MEKRTMPQLDAVTTAELIAELRRRGGYADAVGEAMALVERKSQDYNGTAEPGAARDAYFPFGLASYAQMVHTKALRLVSLAQQQSGAPQFESARDTCLDLINYAAFCADWLRRKKGS